MTEQQAILEELEWLRARLEGGAPWKTGTVVAVDRAAQTADLDLAHGDRTIRAAGIPIGGDFIPDLGSDVLVLMGEVAPMILPTTSSGSIARQGLASTQPGNNVAENPTFELVDGNRVPGGNFETLDLAGWTVGPNTSMALTTAQKVSGAQSVLLTATAAGVTLSLVSQRFPVRERRRYAFQQQVRAVSTSRGASKRIRWYAADGTLLKTDATGSTADSSGAWIGPFSFFTAPTGAAYADLTVNVGANDVALGEGHYVDDFVAHEQVIGWDATDSAEIYTYDASTELHTGVSATLSQYTGANPPPMNGPGALLATSTGAVGFGADSPGGTGGVQMTTFATVNAVAFVRMPVGTRSVQLTLSFWTAAGALISTFTGPVVAGVDNSRWFQVPATTFAPVNSAFASARVATTTGAIGEKLLIDSLSITKSPSNTFIDTSTTLAHSGTHSMLTQLFSTGLATVLTPPGNVIDDAIDVVPGDTWKASVWYRDAAGTTPRRPAWLTAFYFDASGAFVGQQMGTVPFTQPPDAWLNVQERFRIPAGVAKMRVGVQWIGTTGQTVHFDDVEIARDSVLTGRIVPQGGIDDVDIRTVNTSLALASLPAVTWSVAGPYAIPNPGQPVRVAVLMTCTIHFTAATFVQSRVGISLDNGLSWTYGETTRGYVTQLLFGAGDQPWVAATSVTGNPTDGILVRAEFQSNVGGVCDVRDYTVQMWTLPAPPAGEQ